MVTYYSPTNINSGDEMLRQKLYYQGVAKQERKEIRHISNLLGLAILMFELIQLIFSLVLAANPVVYDLYENSSVFQDCSSILFIEVAGLVIPFGIIAFFNRKKYKVNIVPNEKIGFAKCARWVGFGMLCCIGADFVVSGVIALFNVFGYDLDVPESLVPSSPFACVTTIVATAIVPALCEEFAMRCCSLGLMRNYGKAFGVVSVSIIFGLLHGNVVQFVFAGLVGLIVGYATVKTGSIWPAIFIHGCNNAMSAIGDVAEYAAGNNSGLMNSIASFAEKTLEADLDELLTIVMFGFWIVAGAICIIFMLVKGEFKNEKTNARELPYSNSIWSKLGAFLSAPLMLLSFPFLIWSTVVSIVPIE